MSRIVDLIAELCPDGVEFARLGELVKIRNGRDYKALGLGEIPVYGTGGVMLYVDAAAHPGPSVLIPRKGSLDKLYYVDKPFWTVDTIFYTEIGNRLIPKFLYYHLSAQHLEELNQAGGIPSLTQSVLNLLTVPVPPLEVQREIVRVLDEFTLLEAELEAELGARRRQYGHYRRVIMAPAPHWRTTRLRDVVEFQNAKAHERLVDPDGDVTLLTAGFISSGGAKARFVQSKDVLTPAQLDDVALVMSDLPNGRALAKAFFVDTKDKYAANQRVCLLRPTSPRWLDAKFLFYAVDRNSQLLAYNSGVDQTHLKKDWILDIQIDVPPIEEQRLIAKTLDNFDALVNDLSIGLPAELTARRKQYEYYRDRLLTFEEAAV